MKEFLMGNEAIALGAIHAGVNFVCGYPGTPSTEILETIAKRNDGSIYVEWSTNEKSALEVGAGAAYCGARTLVTMKQVGLNVASDPLMSLAYIGVKGGMVIVSADDPGPISSQTEQDTRHFAQFSKLPVFDPSSPEEAYFMIKEAFEFSEKHQTPVLFRPTTRVCHGCADIFVSDEAIRNTPEGFIKDTSRWVIFPRLSYQNHIKIEKRNAQISNEESPYNFVTGKPFEKDGKKLAIASGGISYEYVREALDEIDCAILKVGMPHPFPEKIALDFLKSVDEVMVFEELDPVIEKELIYICGKHKLSTKVFGKLSGDVANAGENSNESAKAMLGTFLGVPFEKNEIEKTPDLPIRPPVLCAGCPHRASFYAVKMAMKGQKAFFAGDIGCYTLGNAQPLDMVDTCLCMGADVTIAQGVKKIEGDTKCFSFIGDSTFFASGITGVVNAVYNGADIVLVVLDNSTTAMTGHQPHPGTGVTMMGDVTQKISIENTLRGIGVESVETIDPLDQKRAIEAVKRASEIKGVSAIIFRSPCIAVTQPNGCYTVAEEKCIKCKRCISQLGCPAISMDGENIVIEKSLCFGCGLCEQVCPTEAIKRM